MLTTICCVLILSVVSGLMIARIALRILEDVGEYIPMPPDCTDPTLSEIISEMGEALMSFSTVIGILVSLVASTIALCLEAPVCAIFTALLGGVTLPLLLLVVVLLITGVCYLCRLVVLVGKFTDNSYRRVKQIVKSMSKARPRSDA